MLSASVEQAWAVVEVPPSILFLPDVINLLVGIEVGEMDTVAQMSVLLDDTALEDVIVEDNDDDWLP